MFSALSFGIQRLPMYGTLLKGGLKPAHIRLASFGVGMGLGVNYIHDSHLLSLCSSENNNDTDNDDSDNKKSWFNLPTLKSTSTDPNNDAGDALVDHLIDLYGPSVLRIGSGGVIGFCVGMYLWCVCVCV